MARNNLIFRNIWEAIRYPISLLKTREKTLTWEEILNFDTKEELFNSLVEKFVYSLGRESSRKRWKKLREKYGIPITEDDIEILSSIAFTRNIILHNGGILTQNYLKEAKNQTFILGEYVDVTSEFIIESYQNIRRICFNIYESVNQKFFDYKIPKKTLRTD